MRDDPAKPSRPSLEDLSQAILASYRSDERMHHIDAGPLPSRARAIELLEKLRDLFFPGYFCDRRLTEANITDHVAALLAEIRERLESQIEQAVCYARNLDAPDRARCTEHEQAEAEARRITDAFLARVPHLRALLALDVQAAYDGDPAARNTDETIFCYPGLDAVFTHRVAHELHRLGVPVLPRILSEYVHNETGVDIHPGATIGHSFFIDHGTGVVVGETTLIGNRVKLYQGVTLGALSVERDANGRLIRGTKRHPTIEDDVIIYANAIVLGGATIIGRGSVIGGSVFLTKSVPPNHYVTLKSPELRFRSADTHRRLETQANENAE
ncbi:MAG: serine acetyltransferase [Planctomycetes bacterium]|nr:serine acetyltransferase [Planctomycetota bacterium]